MPKKKLHFILLFTSIFAMLFSVSGCMEEVFVDGDQALKRPESSVRFVQADASYGTTTFSIYGREVEGQAETVVATATLDYTDVSGYFTIPSGTRRVRIQSAQGEREVNATFSADYQTSFTVGRGGALTNVYERYKYSDEGYKLDDGKGTLGALRFRNFLDVGVYLMLDDIDWNDGYSVSSGSSVFYYAEATGPYEFILQQTASPYPEITRMAINIAGNTRYTVMAFGTVNSPILKVFTDDGK